MPVFRKIPVWMVLASYLFANTVASSWHDHRDCSDHSQRAHQHTADCVSLERQRGDGERCRNHDHDHCEHGHGHHEHGHHSCQNHEPGGNHPPGHLTSATNRQGNDGDDQHAPQHCIVCDFLALAPLSVAQTTLASAGEVLPEFVVLRVLPVCGTTVETHLARGPPAV